MKIGFSKYHGTGNDFILIDDRTNTFPRRNELVQAMCSRHFGIGADGLILLKESKGHDFEMIYYNSDGNESTMCGNGGRCTIAFADFLSLIGSKARFTAIDGLHEGIITGRNDRVWQVRLNMSDVKGYERIGEDIFMNTGSPHLVLFKEGISLLDVVKEGRAIRYSDRFAPSGTNVDFAEWKDDALFVRSYERGVEDETLSCGTGVTASSLVYALRNHLKSGTVQVNTLGGKLAVSFELQDNVFRDIWLEGPATRVFDGHYHP